jgi:ankyrin repeat protein
MAACTENSERQIAALYEAIARDEGSRVVYILLVNDWDPLYPFYSAATTHARCKNCSPWEEAIRSDRYNVVENLLEMEQSYLGRDWRGALLPKSQSLCDTQMGWSLLHLSLFYRSFRASQLLLTFGASPADVAHLQGIPLLLNLVPIGKPNDMEYLSLLLRHGADIDQAKLIHSLIAYSRLDGIRLAANYPHDINLRDALGRTPLILSTQRTERSPKIFLFLLQQGADPNLAGPDGLKPIHLIARNSASLRVELLNALVTAGADPTALTTQGQTALHVLSANTRKANDDTTRVGTFVQALVVGYGVNVNSLDFVGRTPLHVAVTQGNLSVVQALLQHGADADIVDGDGWTAWHLACVSAIPQSNSSLDILRHLHTAVSDPLGLTPTGRTVLQEAILALSVFDDATAFAEVCRLSVQLLGSAVLSIPDPDGLLPLHYAALSGCAEITRILLQAGADVNARDRVGRSALHFCCGLRLRLKGRQPLSVIEALLRPAVWERPRERKAVSVNDLLPLRRQAVDGVILDGLRSPNSSQDSLAVVLLSSEGADAVALDDRGNLPFAVASVNHAPLSDIFIMVQTAALQGLFYGEAWDRFSLSPVSQVRRYGGNVSS